MWRRRIGGAAAGAFLIGILVCAVLPGAVDRSVPASWYWPERRATHSMRMEPWPAGERLMQLADPARWRWLSDAAVFANDNADVLSACRTRAVKAHKPIRCIVRVRGEPFK